MQSSVWEDLLKSYINDLAQYYNFNVQEIVSESCKGLFIKGQASEIFIMLDKECQNYKDKMIKVTWGIPKFYIENGITNVDISYLEEYIRSYLKIGNDKLLFEKSYKEYLRPKQVSLEALRRISEVALGSNLSQFENTLIKFYATGRMLVKKTSFKSDTTFSREKFVKIAEDLDLVQLNYIVPSNEEYLYVYSLTPLGIELAQKLSEEMFTAKQSIVGMWLDRHDPATAYLAAYAVSHSSIYANYPNCCMLTREATTKVHHIPCAVKGKNACEKLLTSQLPPKLALFADFILYSDSISEMLYNTLYELTASYLASLNRAEISGKDSEVFCIVPDLTKAILDATREEFVKKFQKDENVEPVASLAATIMLLKDGYNEDFKKSVISLFGLDEKNLERILNEMGEQGIIDKESYRIVNVEKLVEYAKAKVEEVSVNLGLY